MNIKNFSITWIGSPFILVVFCTYPEFCGTIGDKSKLKWITFRLYHISGINSIVTYWYQITLGLKKSLYAISDTLIYLPREGTKNR